MGFAESKAESKLRQPFEIFGVTFAPLLLPLERRLQTLSVVWLLFIILGGPVFGGGWLIYTFLFSPAYRWLAILYVAMVIYQKDISYTGGLKNLWFRKASVWKYFADYFPIKLVKTAELDPSKNYLMGYHPHGVISFGTIGISSDGSGWEETFPGVKRRVITLPLVFWLPVFREVALMMGLCNSSKRSLKNCLSEPANGVTTLVVGGAQEALQGTDDTIELILKNRKGFVKLALETGADLVPCFGFGEQQIFQMLQMPEGSKMRRFQEWFKKKTTFSPVLFYGRGVFNYLFGLMPYRRGINVVVGTPIEVTKSPNPTKEQIETLHEKYVEALEKLYKDYNPTHGDAAIKLVI